jgi:hypothetical protein
MDAKKPRTEDDELRVARALAIEAYAGVESSLVVLLGRLLGTTNDVAAIVFFRITNTSARNGILEQLLEKAHGDRYDTYWHGQAGEGARRRIPGLFALILQLDTRRNEIVHWHPTASVSSTGERWEDLRPAYHWARLTHLKPITTSDLDEFTQKAKFVQASIFAFCMFTTKPDVWAKASGVGPETWTHTFEQPVSYPPSSDHPLAKIMIAG